MKRNLIILLCLLLTNVSFSQLTGQWKGKMEIQGTKLSIVFHIHKEMNGYTATFDSPDQNAFGLPVEKVSFKESKVIINIPAVGAVYNGKMNSNGDSINGTFKQGGLSIPLNLKHVKSVTGMTNRPQTPQKPYPYFTKEVVIENSKDKIQLAGTLTLPDTLGKYPIAVLITGSGPQDRDETIFGHKPFLVLADYLTKKGLGVLRFDDRGVAASTGNFYNATTTDFAEDVKSCIQFLKNHSNVYPDKIGLIGHSEGGIIATMIAANAKDISFIVLMAGSGVCGDKIIYAQTEKMYQDLSLQNIEKQVELRRELISVIQSEPDRKLAKDKLNTILNNNLDILTLQPVQDTVQLINTTSEVFNSDWFRFFVGHNPAEDIEKVTCPVLALIGEKDFQVSPEQNLPAIEEALKKGGNTNFLVKEIPHVNHLFQTANTGRVHEYGKITETISPEVLSMISNWIHTVLFNIKK